MCKWRWGAMLFVFALLAVLACVGYAYYLRREVRSVLDDVRSVSLAADHATAFEALKRKYGNRLASMEGCSADICLYELKVSNHPVSAALRVPYTELDARFDLRGRRLMLVMVDYRSAQPGDSPVVHVQIDFCPYSCGHFFMHPWTQSPTAER